MRFHIGSIIILVCGLCALVPGLLTVAGYGRLIHELLDQPVGGIALIGIGLCGIGAAVMPMLVYRLTKREREAREEDGQT